MTRQVSLAEATYARLRRHRRPGESFSQAIERLMDSTEKDPLSFLDASASRLDPETWIKRIEDDRDNATVDA